MHLSSSESIALVKSKLNIITEMVIIYNQELNINN